MSEGRSRTRKCQMSKVSVAEEVRNQGVRDSGIKKAVLSAKKEEER